MPAHDTGVGSLQKSTAWKSQRISFFLVLIFLISDLGVLANESEQSQFEEPVSSQYSEPILIEGLPPLMCGEELCLRPFETWTETADFLLRLTNGGNPTVLIWIGTAWTTGYSAFSRLGLGFTGHNRPRWPQDSGYHR